MSTLPRLEIDDLKRALTREGIDSVAYERALIVRFGAKNCEFRRGRKCGRNGGEGTPGLILVADRVLVDFFPSIEAAVAAALRIGAAQLAETLE